MGPDSYISVNLSQSSRLQWDLRKFPWKEGVGDQSEYAKDVRRWEALYDNLDGSNGKKLDKYYRGIVLYSKIFGRALDLCEGLNEAKIASEECTDILFSTIHKKDPLYIVLNVFEEMNKLILLKREANEGFPVYEFRFNTQLSKFNTFEPSVAMYGASPALLLLANTGVDAFQRI